ncbi:polysaccharide deacetylase family protein [Tumebacillus flagellatus]|uniref:NodB homology domain-containing protein n=1 Tax=Tumebacillus flagellatus TaxID=1157490 RepID=A0A074LJ74_9BACL|nr:polysaccharide deacetylase family protein [Tumebacillus flagellatus]KEO81144.1 hypothetical protein EL26_22430 [Tumebacillus flagellatus]
MAKWVLEAALALVILYCLLPFLLSRVAGIGVMRKENRSTTVALTFDDGPNPDYTPRVLDLLKEFGVRATFFVVGTQAKQHPELIERMHREGHSIGIHGYVHHPHWLQSPRLVLRNAEKTADIVEEITGVRPTLLRPPWGLLNGLDYLFLRKFRIVLWSVMVGDWRKQDVNRLSGRLRRGLKPGAVIVLHDSDHTPGAERGAPLVMLQALRSLLEESAAQNLHWARVEEMDMDRQRVGTRLWLMWEHLFQRLYGVQKLRSDEDLLMVKPIAFKGHEAIRLEDGTVIQRGDRLLEIHMNNDRLLVLHEQANSEMQLAKMLVKETRKVLKEAAVYLNDPQNEGIKALYGISFIHRGVEPLGFKTLSMSRGLFASATKWYLRVLLFFLHPAGGDRLKLRTDQLVPYHVVLSRQELFSRYL